MAQKKKTKKSAAGAKASAKTSAPSRSGKQQAGARKAGARKAAAPKARARGAAPEVGDAVAQIQRVIDVMVAAGAVEVELEDGGLKMRVRLKPDVPVSMMSYGPAPIAAPVGGPAHPAEHAPAPAAADDPRRIVFKSPMVGTFYRATAPDADPFVEVGDRVGAESTICILEAMKVMNEIKAEMSGEIVEILAQNGEPVEFGQPLFVIKAD
jgi:acetyl-CoA carboxylase biotin carboxyl carrier protein